MKQRSGARPRTGKTPARPRFLLVTPPVADADALAPAFAAACGAADIAAVIVRLAPASDAEMLARIRRLAPRAQRAGAVVLIAGPVHLIAAANADGIHVGGSGAVAVARKTLRDDMVIGAGRLESRHDAMVVGEAGADYVMFGEPGGNGRRPSLDSLTERVRWWAKLFQPPCVAYAGALAEIDPLVRAGADFIALGDEVVWNAREGPALALAAASVHLAVAEPSP